MNKPCVVVDLDGTIADSRGRHHLLRELDDEGRWMAHSLACGDDPCIEPMAVLVRLLAQNNNIALVTGRHRAAEAQTRDWLARHRIPFNRLLMRADDDRTPNGPFKVAAVQQLREEGFTIVLAIDDYAKTVAALTEAGVPTLYVVEGQVLAEVLEEIP